MRVAALALTAVAGMACSRGALQRDAGGAGSIASDAAGSGGGSGATDGGQPGPTPSIDGRGSIQVDCPMSTLAGGWLPMDFLVLFDRSPAGDPAAWSKLREVLLDQITYAGRTDWGLTTFPKWGAACSAATVSPNVEYPVAPDNWEVAANIQAASSGGAGMPAAAVIDVGAAHLLTLAPEEPKFLMLVTDRPPTCTGSRDQLASGDPAQAEADALAAIARAAAAKIGTIVLAPSATSGSTAAALDRLAEAGGYARAVGAHKFRDETTLYELFMPPWALSCTLPLKYAPPDREVTHVTFNGVEVLRDTEHINGWDYVATPTTYALQLYGTWCDQLIASRKFEVMIWYSCQL